MRQGAVVWAARDASTPAVCHAQAFLRCGLAQVRRLRAVSVSSLARVGKQRRRRGRSASPARRSCRAWKPDGSSSLCLCVRRSGAAHGAALLGATRRLASGPLSCPGMPSDLKATGGGWGWVGTPPTPSHAPALRPRPPPGGKASGRGTNKSIPGGKKRGGRM